jgi:hypothetical protein
MPVPLGWIVTSTVPDVTGDTHGAFSSSSWSNGRVALVYCLILYVDSINRQIAALAALPGGEKAVNCGNDSLSLWCELFLLAPYPKPTMYWSLSSQGVASTIPNEKWCIADYGFFERFLSVNSYVACHFLGGPIILSSTARWLCIGSRALYFSKMFQSRRSLVIFPLFYLERDIPCMVKRFETVLNPWWAYAAVEAFDKGLSLLRSVAPKSSYKIVTVNAQPVLV